MLIKSLIGVKSGGSSKGSVCGDGEREETDTSWQLTFIPFLSPHLDPVAV